jgi:ribulose-phosphate 3-epimerase
MAGLAPSIIAADFGRLAEELERVEPFSARWHVDVMDGHYVPNLTIGPMIVEAIARTSSLAQDVHLMITNPDESWEWYAKVGAARIAFHPDASADPAALLSTIAGAGIGPGLAVNPDVEPEVIKAYLDLVDHLVVMSVHPGFSGQKFIPEVLPTLKTLRGWVDDRGGGVELIIDGGVNLETAPGCVAAGADVLVSASAIFGAPDPARAAQDLREIAHGASS